MCFKRHLLVGTMGRAPVTETGGPADPSELEGPRRIVADGASHGEPARLAASPGDEIGSQIFVSNHSVTPVRVYVEDADGVRHELGRVERGASSMFEAPDDAGTRRDFRVLVRPCEYRQFSRDPVSIKTGPLDAAHDQMVILWLARDLSRSKGEVRQG